jgi:hypothetical protein
MVERAFYCTVADSRVFPGVVALFNSLRLTDNPEPMLVLDAGLSDEQHRILARRCRVARVPELDNRHPALMKPFPGLLSVEGTLVFVDSDLIVTDSLAEVIEAARRGAICAFADPDSDRYFDEWKRIFDLRHEPRHQTYVSTSLVAFSTTRWPYLLSRWAETCERISGREVFGRSHRQNAVNAADQDALNALLMSELPETAPRVLPATRRVQQLLVGLLNRRDVPLPLPIDAALPLWLIDNELGFMVLLVLSGMHWVRDVARESAAARVLRWLRRWRSAREKPDHAT